MGQTWRPHIGIFALIIISDVLIGSKCLDDLQSRTIESMRFLLHLSLDIEKKRISYKHASETHTKSTFTRIKYYSSIVIILSCCLPSRVSLLVRSRTRDRKAASSNPGRSGGRIFFSRSTFLCWLFNRCPFHPRVAAVALKRPRSFCQKCNWQVTPNHAYTLDSTKSEWAEYVGIMWEPIRKRVHTQLVKEHSVTVVSVRWAAMAWFWPKEWN